MNWSSHGRQALQQQQQASPAANRQRQQQQQQQQSRSGSRQQPGQQSSQQQGGSNHKPGGSGQQSTGQPSQSGQQNGRPEWMNEYEIIGKIGEGTYGLVYLAKHKDKAKGSGKTAIKKFKQGKEGEGVSPTAIREIMLLRECSHENIVKLVNVHTNLLDMSLYLAFDYAEHDFYEIIRFHRDSVKSPMKEYTVKSLLWQLLNGLHYLHSNWIIHRDLKPSNILVMGEGEEQGVVKIADFGLARIYQAPLRPLSDNGVVVTIWYRAPELLLGSRHYTPAVDMWAVGCIFAEMLALKPLFQGIEDKSSPHAFQKDQLDKIFRVLGHPTVEKWPMLPFLPHWQDNRQLIQDKRYDHPTLRTVLPPTLSAQALSLLTAMLEYDPKKRLTAEQAMEHEYFKTEPIPARNAFLSGSPGEKCVSYPQRPVDRNVDFEKGGQQPQQPHSLSQQQQQQQQQQQDGGHSHQQQGQEQKPQGQGQQQGGGGGSGGGQHSDPSQRQGSGSSQSRTTRERSNLGSSGQPNKTRRLQ